MSIRPGRERDHPTAARAPGDRGALAQSDDRPLRQPVGRARSRARAPDAARYRASRSGASAIVEQRVHRRIERAHVPGDRRQADRHAARHRRAGGTRRAAARRRPGRRAGSPATPAIAGDRPAVCTSARSSPSSAARAASSATAAGSPRSATSGVDRGTDLAARSPRRRRRNRRSSTSVSEQDVASGPRALARTHHPSRRPRRSPP